MASNHWETRDPNEYDNPLDRILCRLMLKGPAALHPSAANSAASEPVERRAAKPKKKRHRDEAPTVADVELCYVWDVPRQDYELVKKADYVFDSNGFVVGYSKEFMVEIEAAAERLDVFDSLLGQNWRADTAIPGERNSRIRLHTETGTGAPPLAREDSFQLIELPGYIVRSERLDLLRTLVSLDDDKYDRRGRHVFVR